FACAINVDPEVLVVDEALAVGDAMFQRRCYRRIEDFQKSGKTILFVSHNLSTVASICTHAMFLDKGTVVQVGKPKDVVNAYSKVMAERETEYAKRMRGGQKEAVKVRQQAEDERIVNPTSTRFGSGGAEILDLKIINSEGKHTTVLQIGERYVFKTTVLFKKDIPEPDIGINIVTLTGLLIYDICPSVAKKPMFPIKANSKVTAEFELLNNLNPGTYAANVNVAEFLPDQRVFLERRLDILTFKVIGVPKCYGLVDLNAHIRISEQ
ncbi:MAG TPA: hypothetical protein DD713_06655, partial [Nitrospiraceae bacterium]|nr:hypothetical protein [Nitrospiraceae bacterium]